MRLFEEVQRNFAVLGISSIAANQNSFNCRTVIGLLTFGSSTFLHLVFLFHEAKTFGEYTDNIYMTTATVATAVCFINVILNMNKVFQYIESLDEIVNKSEYVFPIEKNYIKISSII